MLRWLVREVTVYVAIALDLALGTLTWLLVLALIPGDRLGFNTVGSLVLIVLCSAPYALVHAYLRRVLPQYQD